MACAVLSRASVLSGAGVTARAEDPPERLHLFARHHKKKEGTPPPGKPRCIPHTDERAGYPRALSGHLEPSTTPGGIGYYVGGGVPSGTAATAEVPPPRRGDLGLGRDRRPHFRRRVILGWSQRTQVPGRHGRLSHRRPRRARPDLRHHQHAQQPGPPRGGRGPRIGRHEQGSPVLIAERTDEQTGSPSSRGCIAPSKSPCGSGELFDYSRRRCSRRVASRPPERRVFV